jgi:hypothetical protein
MSALRLLKNSIREKRGVAGSMLDGDIGEDDIYRAALSRAIVFK